MAMEAALTLGAIVFMLFNLGVKGQKEACTQGYELAYDFEDCNKYYQCVGPLAVSMSCPGRLIFSLEVKGCVFHDDPNAQVCLKHSSNQNGKKIAQQQLETKVQEERNTEDNDLNEELIQNEIMALADMDKDKNEELLLAAVGLDNGNGMNSLWPSGPCQTGKDIVPHETLCHRYYNCSKPHTRDMNRYLAKNEYECPYPLLFSEDSMSCEDFQSVDCKSRMEYLNPCDYAENMCSGPNCIPCNVDHGSCIGQPDGFTNWPGREGSGFWVECRGQRTLSQGNCVTDEKTMINVFSSKLKKCVPYNEVIEEVCLWSEERLPHPYDCHIFYDCKPEGNANQEGDEIKPLARMCPYPMLYSVDAGKCESPELVDCGQRRETKKPCDYMPSECQDPDFASCEGLADGKNVFRTREGTPHFVVCEKERTIGKDMCEMDDRGMFKQFSPGLGNCMPV